MYMKVYMKKEPIRDFKHFKFVAKWFYVCLICAQDKSRVFMKLIYWAIPQYKNVYVCVCVVVGFPSMKCAHTHTHTTAQSARRRTVEEHLALLSRYKNMVSWQWTHRHRVKPSRK
jgi:hypothetical protein